MKAVVTGGAGFIGSHVADHLLKLGHSVRVIDNLSTGRRLFFEHNLPNPRFTFIRADVLNRRDIDSACNGADCVFHLAAHADVRSGYTDRNIDHRQNLEATQSVLEAMHNNGVGKIMFASTSSVYGDATVHPTPEDYPFEPSSLYGATKGACETYIQAYARYYAWQAYIFRFVSFIGERYTHGIIADMLKKLDGNPANIDLLSDGTPRKSSVYVADGIRAIFTAMDKTAETVNIFNIGHDDVLTVNEIVTAILEKTGRNPRRTWLGGVRGWIGDNDFVHLATSKLKSLGWKPELSFREGINRTIDYLTSHPELYRSRR